MPTKISQGTCPKNTKPLLNAEKAGRMLYPIQVLARLPAEMGEALRELNLPRGEQAELLRRAVYREVDLVRREQVRAKRRKARGQAG